MYGKSTGFLQPGIGSSQLKPSRPALQRWHIPAAALAFLSSPAPRGARR